MDIDEIKGLLDLMEDRKIHEVEYAKGDERIRIVRAQAAPPAREAEPPSLKPPVPAGAPAPVAEMEKKLVGVNSPFVGTFYGAPSPSEKPFVEIGSRVKKGQTIAIVEAMKLMNAIEADADGSIRQILKKDGDPVEFGEPLFIIDPENA